MKKRAKRKSGSKSPQSKSLRGGKMFGSACAGLLGLGLGGAADAFEVNESTSPLVTAGDFDDDFPGESLPSGVTSIVGSVGFPREPGPEIDPQDYFQLTNLLPGSPLGITLNVDTQYFFSISDSEGNGLSSTSNSEGNEVMAEVPANGIVVGWHRPGEGGIANNYTMAVSATYVPEPGTGALAALGAAALLGLSQRKRD